MDRKIAREYTLGTLSETGLGQARVFHGESIQINSQFMAIV